MNFEAPKGYTSVEPDDSGLRAPRSFERPGIEETSDPAGLVALRGLDDLSAQRQDGLRMHLADA